MKNESRIVKFTAFVLLLTMIVLCLVSGTFAKYTSHFAGTDTAIVAVWDVSDGDIAENFDIFDHSKIYDLENANFDTPVADADVYQDPSEEAKIAPGTWGSFTYELTNGSDVTTLYEIAYTADEAGIPLEWSLNGSDWENNVAELNQQRDVFTESEEVITLYWRWVFENSAISTDEADTALGKAGVAAPSIKIDVTFTQKD